MFASKPVEEETRATPSSESSTKLRAIAVINEEAKASITESAASVVNTNPTPTEVAQVVPSTPTPTDTPITTPKITPSSSSLQVQPIQHTIAKEKKKKISKPINIPDIKHPIVEIRREVEDTKKKRARSIESKPKAVKKKKKEDEILKPRRLQTLLPKQQETQPVTPPKQLKVQPTPPGEPKAQPTPQAEPVSLATQQMEQVSLSEQQVQKPKQRRRRSKKLNEAEKANMIWVDVDEPVPEDMIEDFIYDNDTEFTDELYQAYLDRLERIEKMNLERGIRVVEPELMVLSHVAIEPYTL